MNAMQNHPSFRPIPQSKSVAKMWALVCRDSQPAGRADLGRAGHYTGPQIISYHTGEAAAKRARKTGEKVVAL